MKMSFNILKIFNKKRTSGTSSDNEWQRWQQVAQWVTTSDNEWQQVTTSGTKNENEWQRVVPTVATSDSER